MYADLPADVPVLKIDIPFLAFLGLAGVGAYLLLKRNFFSGFATNVIPIYNYPTLTDPENPPPDQTGPEKWKEDYLTPGVSTVIGRPRVDLPEVEIPIDPRITQANALELDARGQRLGVLSSISYGPLSEAQIARELQRKPIGSEGKKHGWKVLSGYPGFIRRPDGLLQWDGHTIPDFLKNLYDEAREMPANCSGVSRDTGKMACNEIKVFWRHKMELLRNRPWYPGYDVTEYYTPFFKKNIEHLSKYQSNPATDPPVFKNALADTLSRLAGTIPRLNKRYGKPSPMITAQEELDIRNKMPVEEIIAKQKQSGELKRAAHFESVGLSPEGLNISSYKDPGDYESQMQEYQEQRAKKAAAEAKSTLARQQGRTRKMQELQRWTNSNNYMGSYIGMEGGKSWFRRRRGI